MVVEPDLAERPHARAPGQRGAHDLVDPRRLLGEPPGLVRVHARGEADLGPERRHPIRPPRLGRAPGRQHAQRLTQPRLPGPFHDVGKVPLERLVGEVAVGVDHLTLLPGGGPGSSKVTSEGLPPSGLAASTMPFDSMPISVVGLRLNTMATVRPTSDSAS